MTQFARSLAVVTIVGYTVTTAIAVMSGDSMEGSFGSCGNRTWWFFLEESLQIMGNGTMEGECDFTDDMKDAVIAVWIRENVTSIAPGAFQDFKNLFMVEIYDKNFTQIGDGAFNGCSKLESISIPDSVEIIGKDAFRGCTY